MTAKQSQLGNPDQATPDDQSSEVRQRIVDAALSLFGEHGFEGVSVRDICQAANTTAPMIYYYFGSKEGLHHALVEESVTNRETRLKKMLQIEGDPLTRLRRILEVCTGVDDTSLAKERRLLLVRDDFSHGSEAFKQMVEGSDRALRHAIGDVLRDGIEAGVFRPLQVNMTAIAIIGIINTFTRRIALGAPFSMENAIEQVMDTFVLGMALRDEVQPRYAL